MRSNLILFKDRYVDYVIPELNYLNFYKALERAPYSYNPLFDACVIRVLPPHIKGEQLTRLWNNWFKKIYSSPHKYKSKNPVLELVLRDLSLVPIYEIFQHEIRAHRLPIAYSTLGILLASLQFRANRLFLRLLKDRYPNKRLPVKTMQKLTIIETHISDLVNSLRYVTESLATFRDMVIRFELSKRIDKNITIGKVAASTLSDWEEKLKINRRYFPYLIGYKMALTIFNKIGFDGIEVCVTYALNPELSEKDFFEYNSNISSFFRYNNVVKFPKQGIPSNLNLDDPFTIDSFIRDKFGWNGWNKVRDNTLKIAKNIFPEIVESGFPSKDFFLPSNKKGTVIPEFIFVQSETQKNILAKSKGKYLDKLWVNFLTTLFRTEAKKILSRGIIKFSYCPFHIFYGSSELCDFYTEGIACKMVKRFCNEYRLSFKPCS